MFATISDSAIIAETRSRWAAVACGERISEKMIYERESTGNRNVVLEAAYAETMTITL